MQRGTLIYGLPGSGKTTLGARLGEIARKTRPVVLLDGDVMRKAWPEIGYDDAGRAENMRRLFELAEFYADRGFHPVVSAVAPYRHHRRPFLDAGYRSICLLTAFVDRGHSNPSFDPPGPTCLLIQSENEIRKLYR